MAVGHGQSGLPVSRIGVSTAGARRSAGDQPSLPTTPRRSRSSRTRRSGNLRPVLTRQKRQRRHDMRRGALTGLLQSILILGVASTAFAQTWYQGIVTNYGSAYDHLNPWQGSYGTSEVRGRLAKNSQPD